MSLFEVKDGTAFQMNYEKIDGLLPRTTLFVHGNFASNRWWYPTEKVLRAQASRFNAPRLGSVLLAEFRGSGQSTAPASVNDVNVRLFAKDYIALVRSLNLGKINLVGHSAGGLIAGLMLAQAPELFNQAILLDPVGALGIRNQPDRDAIFSAMKSDKTLVAAVMAATIYQCDQGSDFFRQIVVEDAFLAARSLSSMLLKSLDPFDATAELSMVKHKILVLHGEHDTLLPLEESRALAKLFKNGSFEVIRGQGHCTNVENPELFVQIVNRFFAN